MSKVLYYKRGGYNFDEKKITNLGAPSVKDDVEKQLRGNYDAGGILIRKCTVVPFTW